ncbi:bifunctional serine/threonine-protein kinase/formylglycine-generating enzyme family protein [Candidatus Protochlamydia phocaeensis]|uniref:bifunctional serine/threonine-protein kinase/formylglycine-generating enzyme family protein n=1 Tax=Candidatus Protochlamydia phocaeensis TaxID=1414722 RepID=UPI0008395D07|nr:bifunctional serine/threonine-protein kinase/formylglycine-generating enzyme family protein [Candidatus Protochlamydia phocaeensis]
MEPRILGDYNIIKPIGQGTLGTVFLAEHRFMKRQYVLKVLPEELASDRSFIQRFEEDVGALAALDHPNIVKVYNISFAQGIYFLVTDCIVDELGETTNLAQYIMGLGRPLEEEEIFYLLKRIADPLDYAHAKKVGNRELVHRSLKLNNILIGKRKQGLDVYLSDFGLMRIIGPGAVLTRTYKNVAEALGIGLQIVAQKAGQDRYPNPPLDQQKLIPLHTSFLQNYAFLAPEQKRLDSPYPVDHKADIYAFGVLTYFLLFNELPEGIFEMPSARRGCRYNWDSLLRHCLQNHPSKRPDSLMEVLDSIKQPEKIAVANVGIDFVEERAGNLDAAPMKIFKEEPKQTQEEQLPVQMAAKYAVAAESVNLQPVAALAKPEEGVHLEEEVAEKTLTPVLQMPQLERPQHDLDPGAIFQSTASVKVYSPERKDVTNVKPILTDMIVIRGGSFYRGSHDGNRDEMPRHQVNLPSFAIDIHPVTNEQFVRFLEVMGGEKDSNHNDIIRLRDSRIKRSGGKLSIESGYAKHPVVGVTWYGAIAYAKWVGKRLPTEAEWEIAARGGSENVLYPTGDDIEKTQANFFSSDTTAVMSYAANGYGLYDMAGNVYEWCHDWYGYNYYEVSIQEPENPPGPLQGVYRVLRGGCWKSLKEDLRCSRRHRNNPGTVNGTYGFRCATDVQIS